MRQHISCFIVFIIIIGLISIGTVDAGTITENFDSDSGWQSVNLPIYNADFGFRNSEFAGGNAGEAGGLFNRINQLAWYGHGGIGNFTGNEVLSASGLMNIYNVDDGYNNSIHIGHFDSSGPAELNGIGIQILDQVSHSPFSFRIFYEIGDDENLLFTITGINESRTWSYFYDPNDGSYGSLTVSISGSGGGTVKHFLSESQRNSIGTLDTFGLALADANDIHTEQLELYIDNVSYEVQLFADFSANPTSGKAPLEVNFSDQSIGATSWSWDFGDNSTSTEQNPSHTYTDSGTYTVSLTITGPVGSDSKTETDYITVYQYDFTDVATSAVLANMYFSTSLAYSGYAIDDPQYYSLAQLYAQSAHDYAEDTYEKASDALIAGASFWGTYAVQYAQLELDARAEALTYIDLAVQYATAGDYVTAEYYLGYSLALSATANLYNGSVIWCASMESEGGTK